MDITAAHTGEATQSSAGESIGRPLGNRPAADLFAMQRRRGATPWQSFNDGFFLADAPPRPRERPSAFDERLFDDKMPRLAVVAFAETTRLEHLPQLLEHARATAHHDPVGFDLKRRQADIVEQLFGSDQVGDAAAVAERLAGDGRVIQKLFAQQRPEKFVVSQSRHQLFAISEFGDLPAAMNEDNG